MLSMRAVVGPLVSSPKRLRIFKILYPTKNQHYRIHPRSTTPFHVIPDGRRNLGGEGRMSRKVGRRGEKNSDSSSASRPRRAGREKERKRERERATKKLVTLLQDFCSRRLRCHCQEIERRRAREQVLLLQRQFSLAALSFSPSLPFPSLLLLENCLLKFNLENSWAALSCPLEVHQQQPARPTTWPFWDLASTERARGTNHGITVTSPDFSVTSRTHDILPLFIFARSYNVDRI